MNLIIYINHHIKDKTENTNDKIHTIDESSLNHVRKKLVKYVKNELIQEILEKNKKLSINIHIKVTSYMYYNSATTHLVEKICVNQLHIDDKVDYYLKNIKPKPQAVGTTKEGKPIWRCTICGYEYVGEELPDDFICPICKHPASDFEKVVV